VLEQDTGVHARKDGGMTARTDGEITQVEAAGEDFVSLQEFIGYGQGGAPVVGR